MIEIADPINDAIEAESQAQAEAYYLASIGAAIQARLTEGKSHADINIWVLRQFATVAAHADALENECEKAAEFMEDVNSFLLGIQQQAVTSEEDDDDDDDSDEDDDIDDDEDDDEDEDDIYTSAQTAPPTPPAQAAAPVAAAPTRTICNECAGLVVVLPTKATPFTCQECHKESFWATVNVPRACTDCAIQYSICQYCQICLCETCGN